jgi:hypothetical protein
MLALSLALTIGTGTIFADSTTIQSTDQTTSQVTQNLSSSLPQNLLDLRSEYRQLTQQNKELRNQWLQDRKEIRQELQSTNQDQQVDRLQNAIQKAQQKQQRLEQAVQAEDIIIQNYKTGDLTQFNALIEKYRAAGDLSLKAFVNGRLTQGDVHPFTQDGHAMLPLRAIAESLNAQVSFKDGVITISRGNTTINLTPDSNTAIVNGQEIAIAQPPIIMSGRTFVPVRFISEQLGANVNYIQNGNIVAIDNPTTPAPTTSGSTTTSSNTSSVTQAVYSQPTTGQ